MAIKLPEINISFKQLSTTAVERSERSIAVLLLKDDTDENISYVKFSNATELEGVASSFTSENIQYMKDVFNCNASTLIAVRLSTDDSTSENKVTLAQALEVLTTVVKTGWIALPDATGDQFSTLASWIKDKSEKGFTFKTVVYKTDNLDHINIVNFYNETVTFNDERGEVSGIKYIPSLVGILASTNILRSTTYYTCPNLVNCSVFSEDDANDNLNKGRLFLMLDEEEVKIASGINSLVTTNGKTLTDDMKYIETVEAMHLISDDIRDVFKTTYIGKYKNTYINQRMFISSINAYFKDLAKDYILDPEYSNSVDVDVEAQKTALESTGKDTSTMTDQEIRYLAYKRSVFLAGDIKILNCMENLEFEIALY